MNYTQTLDYLYRQLPMFQRVGQTAFKKDLTNITTLCEHLGNPHQQFESIHIAGTNGKGSTAHILSAILQRNQLKVGLYTSPHYKHFRERIKINGRYLPKQWLVDFVAKHHQILQQIKPSFFEITVAMAFQYFAEQKVTIAIIETGLGGRLDSTNIITPLQSVITNISYDHQQFLGDTLEAIAGEKAGIIKSNVPVIIGENQPDIQHVFVNKAKAENSPIYFAHEVCEVKEVNHDLEHTYYDIKVGKNDTFDNVKINLRGPFQVKNVRTAFTALQILKSNHSIKDTPFFINEENTKEGLANLKKWTNYKGRWQVIGQKPTIICDSAHNEGGLKIAFQALQEIPHQTLHIILGTVNDKDLEKVFPLFPQKAIYYFAKAKIPRGLDATQLRDRAAAFGLKGRSYSSVRNALNAAKRKAHTQDLIFVGGSIFVVAEVIR